MNTDFTDEYKKWISNLSESNFNELIKGFAAEYYETKEIHISNGPYDGGIDLVYSKNGVVQKRNIQITVHEKGYEKKLIADIKKSADNVKQYSYQAKLDFYISQKISQSKADELIRKAEVDFGIDLKIYDANKLAGLSSNYKSIRDIISKYNKIAFPDEKINIDKNSKILFDTLTMGKDTTQLKNDIIKSFILFYFFEHGESSVAEVIESLTKVFYDKFKPSFYENEVGKLKSDNLIELVSDEKPKKYDLCKETRNKFELID
ncbi:MAG: hypothetical protein AB7D46_01865, partial [Flavobacteriaceae bacterium]